MILDVVIYTVTQKIVPSLFFCNNLVSSLSIFVIFRSTPLSRPNNIRQGNVRTSVGTSIRHYTRLSTKSLSNFNEIWYVHTGR